MTSLRDSITATVGDLDPELFADPTTTTLVELGAGFISEVTDRYGSPSRPVWATGKLHSEVFMAYHCAGPDGHTSVGPLGDGVPRAALHLTAAINRQANREVLDPLLRAIVFYAACAHDHTQLCGRALLPEGQGSDRGDERLSALEARQRADAAGLPADVGVLAQILVMATAFDPTSRTQNVDYKRTSRAVLAQEVTAAADLLSLTSRRGPLSALEMVCESLTTPSYDRIVHRQFAAATAIHEPAWLLDCISGDPILTCKFRQGLHAQVEFFLTHRFSDPHIRQACGLGIDELFPGRADNADVLAEYITLLNDHTPRELWNVARTNAGY
ncbi:hypothetical protein ACIGO9_31830 [Nocardia asteroides]|uniref:hypothetical protein n=1 Tax=Nocardia asteroides TaxID=1824 RepID=UPI0037CC8783